ncbi:MAG: PilZ domain-containing protein [Phycisphaeraceae bacterium]|nr:PilZ domain-containing protein [Phycisphaeraceae bacterium]
MSQRERRRFPRHEISGGVKIQCQMTGRYFAGQSRNLSEGGMLIEVDHPSLMISGQRLRVSRVAEADRGLLSSDNLLWATVVRSAPNGRGQMVALCFDVVGSESGRVDLMAA